MIVTIAVEGFSFIKFISYVHHYNCGCVYPFLLSIFHVIYKLTIPQPLLQWEAGEGEMAWEQKVTIPGVVQGDAGEQKSLSQEFSQEGSGMH